MPMPAGNPSRAIPEDFVIRTPHTGDAAAPAHA